MFMNGYFKSNLRSQRGAALFTSLVILLLLTILALGAAKVAGLQERMVDVYRSDQESFQRAETVLRESEQEVLANPLICEEAPGGALSDDWLRGQLAEEAARVENLNKPGSQNSIGLDLRGSSRVGQSRLPGSVNCLVFRISSYNVDNEEEPLSYSVVQSTYTP